MSDNTRFSFAARIISITLLLSFLIFGAIFNSNVFAQTTEIDPAFNPDVTKEATSDLSGNIVLQPDGKILVFGVFNAGGTYLKRLNTDGTTDTTFDCAVCDGFNVENAKVLANGKIILTGYTDVAKMYRLNSDGSLDIEYNVSPYSNGSFFVSQIEVEAIQPDGKIIVRHASSYQGYSKQEIFRYNTDGSEDTSFTKTTFGPLRFTRAGYSRVFVQPDGKILIGGTYTSAFNWTGFIFRINADGTEDTTFEIPTFSDSNESRSSVGHFDVYPDGSIIVPGKFTSVNSVNRIDLVRLLPAGNVDLSFTPDNIFSAVEISTGKALVLPDGKFIVNSVQYSAVFPVPGDNGLFRFNSDGTLDNTFNPPTELTEVRDWTIDSANRIVVFGDLNGETKYLRLNADGSLDTSFNPTIIKKAIVNEIAVQPDGKILVYGDFSHINGTTKTDFARINPNGTLDTSFDSGSGFDVVPTEIAVQADGKILAIGDFTTYNGTAVSRIARINSDGSLDTSFNPTFDLPIFAIIPLANGQILVGGMFNTVNGSNQSDLARLNSDGSLDSSFDPIFGSGYIKSIFVETDGKIMVAGPFNGVDGFNRQNLVRLNADGNVDTSFNAGSVALITTVIGQPDGKYLILERFSIERRNNDGSTDSGFQSISIEEEDVNEILLQNDGKILVGGNFASPRPNLTRFLPDGSLDANFFPTGANNTVYDLAKQADGKILVGGKFELIGNVLRSGIARITNNSSTVNIRTPFDFDGDGKSDVSVFRPSSNIWYRLLSSNNSVSENVFGINNDILAPADFDGDGKTDLGIFRPSTASWWYLSSVDNTQKSVQFGANGDIPLPSDINGDGADDFVVFRPSDNTWYRATSDNGTVSSIAFGANGDKPLIGDFDGDGKADPAIFRPSTGDWWYQSSINGAQIANNWGLSDDIPVPADYDGDGKTDLAVYRPSEGGWYIFNSGSGQPTTLAFGVSTDIPVPADYDGDGKADIAVFRPSTGIWYLLQSTNGFAGLQFGISTDEPIPSVFQP